MAIRQNEARLRRVGWMEGCKRVRMNDTFRVFQFVGGWTSRQVPFGVSVNNLTTLGYEGEDYWRSGRRV